MIFWRIVDNKVYNCFETDKLGFSNQEASFIPDDYLDKQEFVVMRTCHGVGDWGIISAMPRLLKEKYPNCKVYVPTSNFLEKMFGEPTTWSWWDNPYQNVNTIFDNNPYVDKFVDEVSGDIFHDHYRIYDDSNSDIPLVNQMLKFWQFKDEEIKDSQPELYWSDEEKKLGDNIIKEHVGNGEFGGLMITNTYPFDRDELLIDILKDNPIPYFYYSPVPLSETSFNFIDRALDLRHVDIRIQLYIRAKAKLNVVGHQNGLTQTVARYTKNYQLQRDFPIGSNFVDGEVYLKDDLKKELLNGAVRKSVSKTTTSMKFKADVIDFFRDNYKNKTCVEIGTSLGNGTMILSGLFKKVITIDNSPSKHHEAKENLKHLKNIDFKLMDVYQDNWDFSDDVDVVFIDCVHTYQHLKSDIDNSIKTFNKPIIFFDDYGLYPELKKLVDEYIDAGKLKPLKKIGQHIGKIYPKTQYKILKDREGIICQTL
tara:strand:+ start:1538 stop:2980 length:1443 start_codon:yes stop_codon:yes gene_type:complete